MEFAAVFRPRPGLPRKLGFSGGFGGESWNAAGESEEREGIGLAFEDSETVLSGSGEDGLCSGPSVEIRPDGGAGCGQCGFQDNGGLGRLLRQRRRRFQRRGRGFHLHNSVLIPFS